jgi:broad specificity phosphatase PhoE
MSMPLHFVLVRHGESEANFARDHARKGNDAYFTDEYRKRADRSSRLTPKGEKQAAAAGKWIQRFIFETHLPDGFGRYDCSPYTRTMETAGTLGLPSANWRLSYLLRERDWGDIEGLTKDEFAKNYPDSLAKQKRDPLLWKPPGGESIMEMTESRVREVYDTCHRELSDSSFLGVTHGEFMWGNRYALEHPTIEEWMEWEKDPDQDLHNCQILHYTRVNPETGEIAKNISWFRSVDPYNNPDSPGEWQTIIKRRFNNDQLLDFAQIMPRLFE